MRGHPDKMIELRAEARFAPGELARLPLQDTTPEHPVLTGGEAEDHVEDGVVLVEETHR
jgi:hypothetical protein